MSSSSAQPLEVLSRSFYRHNPPEKDLLKLVGADQDASAFLFCNPVPRSSPSRYKPFISVKKVPFTAMPGLYVSGLPAPLHTLIMSSSSAQPLEVLSRSFYRHNPPEKDLLKLVGADQDASAFLFCNPVPRSSPSRYKPFISVKKVPFTAMPGLYVSGLPAPLHTLIMSSSSAQPLEVLSRSFYRHNPPEKDLLKLVGSDQGASAFLDYLSGSKWRLICRYWLKTMVISLRRLRTSSSMSSPSVEK